MELELPQFHSKSFWRVVKLLVLVVWHPPWGSDLRASARFGIDHPAGQDGYRARSSRNWHGLENRRGVLLSPPHVVIGVHPVIKRDTIFGRWWNPLSQRRLMGVSFTLNAMLALLFKRTFVRGRGIQRRPWRQSGNGQRRAAGKDGRRLEKLSSTKVPSSPRGVHVSDVRCVCVHGSCLHDMERSGW